MTIFTVVLCLIIIYSCIQAVPQQEVWIVERFGKFSRKLEAGLFFILPFIENVKYKHSLKEKTIDIPEQNAITSDNVTLVIDGILYIKVVDPVAASYGAENPLNAIAQLAQTAMRSEIGKIVLDRTFEERDNLNVHIVEAINEAAKNWGVQCMRYEIKDITPPQSVLEAMELQVAAERKKRAQILDSEGNKQALINTAEAKKAEEILRSEAIKQSKINEAEGLKQAAILESEAKLQAVINDAKGKKEMITALAEADAEYLTQMAQVLSTESGKDAAVVKSVENYITAFQELAKKSNTMILPTNANDVSSVVAQAFATIDKVKKNS